MICYVLFVQCNKIVTISVVVYVTKKTKVNVDTATAFLLVHMKLEQFKLKIQSFLQSIITAFICEAAHGGLN